MRRFGAIIGAALPSSRLRFCFGHRAFRDRSIFGGTRVSTTCLAPRWRKARATGSPASQAHPRHCNIRHFCRRLLPCINGPWAQQTLRSWRHGCGVPTLALFLIYSLVVLALAKRHLSPGFALAATALCMLHIMTIFLSDLLFAELPFAVVSVLFVLVAASGVPTFAAVGARDGVVCACRGRVSSTHNRCGAVSCLGDGGGHAAPMAVGSRAWGARLVPIVLWQAHVERVRASDEYRRPAYSYQRAPYQYYNVSYAENVLLIDPFRPELGTAGRGGARGSVSDESGQNAGGPWRGYEYRPSLTGNWL